MLDDAFWSIEDVDQLFSTLRAAPDLRAFVDNDNSSTAAQVTITKSPRLHRPPLSFLQQQPPMQELR